MSEAIASQGGHWYAQDGSPVYEVPRAKGDGTRPTRLNDARKLNLVPSVTLILNCVSKPGLDAWKLRQMFEVAYTTPRSPEENDDDFFERVSIESREKGRKAAERGTELHAAIEIFASQNAIPEMKWAPHLANLQQTLAQYGIGLRQGKTEHSFASPLGYGGKIDWHNDEVLIDFKTKKDLSAKQLAWPEHCWQLAAYSFGALPKRMRIAYDTFDSLSLNPGVRLINVFIGIDDCEVRIHEWSPEDSEEAWSIFKLLLEFWNLKNHFGEYSKKGNA